MSVSCKLRARVWTERQLGQMLANPHIERIYLPLHLSEASLSQSEKEKIIITPPVFTGGVETDLEKRLTDLKNRGFNAFEVHTLDTVGLGKALGFELYGGFRLNVTNSAAARAYQELGVADLTLSIELSMTRAASIDSSVPRGIAAYGRLPLMLCRRCPISGDKVCGRSGCGKRITDRKGNKLDIICDTCCHILNPHVLNLSDKEKELALFDFAVLLLTVEDNADAVAESFVKRKKPSGQFTRGLYYK